MYHEKLIGVVVPAYNEEGFVGRVIETMPSFVDRIYVVDDCSTDGTWEEILSAAEAAPTAQTPIPVDDGPDTDTRRVVPIRHEHNRGVGGAIKTGYKRALADRVDVTVVMGGDGQMDPEYLTALVDPIVGGYAEYAKANRLTSSVYYQGMSRWRLFGNVLLSKLTRVISGYWQLSDPQNGYTAISLAALETVDIDDMYEYYGYCNDLLVKLNVHGLRVAEVPVPAVYGDEQSSISYGRYIRRVSWMLARNFVWRLRRKYVTRQIHPLVICYALGVVLLIQGLVIALADVNWLVTSLLLCGIGLMLVFVAMQLDRRANRNLEVRLDV